MGRAALCCASRLTGGGEVHVTANWAWRRARRWLTARMQCYASYIGFGAGCRGLARRAVGSSGNTIDGDLRPRKQRQEHDGRVDGPRAVWQNRIAESRYAG